MYSGNHLSDVASTDISGLVPVTFGVETLDLGLNQETFNRHGAGHHETQVHAVTALGEEVRIPDSSGLLADTSESIDVNLAPDAAERLIDATQNMAAAIVSGEFYNCKTFAYDMKRVPHEAGLTDAAQGWEYKSRPLTSMPVLSTGRIASPMHSRRRGTNGHWLTIISAGRSGLSLHVDGGRGRLLISSFHEINEKYRTFPRMTYEATRK